MSKESEHRESQCPFLLRCFWKLSRHNNRSDYSKMADDVFPGNEVHL